MTTYFIKFLPRFLENRKKKILERKRQLIKERENKANSFTNDLTEKILERYPYVSIDLHTEFDWEKNNLGIKISNKDKYDKNIIELKDKLYMAFIENYIYFNAAYPGLIVEFYDYVIKLG
jgi:hypothetical protein